MRIIELHKTYRGCFLGYVVSPYGYRATWIGVNDGRWYEGSILVDTIEEIEALAKECIDFNIHYATERLAYHLWEEAGYPNGRANEFWLSAEKKVLEMSHKEMSRWINIYDIIRKKTQ